MVIVAYQSLDNLRDNKELPIDKLQLQNDPCRAVKTINVNILVRVVTSDCFNSSASVETMIQCGRDMSTV